MRSKNFHKLVLRAETSSDRDRAFWSLEEYCKEFDDLLICLSFGGRSVHADEEAAVRANLDALLSGIRLYDHVNVHTIETTRLHRAITMGSGEEINKDVMVTVVC
jgi:hypothetical protein